MHHNISTSPFALIPARNTWSPSPLDLTSLAHLIHTSIHTSPHASSLQDFPLFIKPSADNSGVGIYQQNKVHNQKELEEAVERLSREFPDQGLLVERFLGGREVTVGIVGTGAGARVVGVMELVFVQPEDGESEDKLKFDEEDGLRPSESVTSTSSIASDTTLIDPSSSPNPNLNRKEIDIYSSTLKSAFTPYLRQHHLPLTHPISLEVSRVALDAWNVLGCRDAGRVDIRYDLEGEGGKPNVIEVNPIPGLTPEWSDLPILAHANGMDFDMLIKEIVEEAIKRSAR